MTEPLSKVDSAVDGLSSSPKATVKDAKRRASSAAAPGVMNILDLGKSIIPRGPFLQVPDLTTTSEAEGTEIELPIETQQTGW